MQRPIAKGELRRVLSDETPANSGAPSADTEQLFSTRSGDVLLVEDSPINQTVLRGILLQLGHTVTLARNGAEAVQVCAEHSFDVVLMDIQMPEVDGLERNAAHSRPRRRQWPSAHAYHRFDSPCDPSDREQSRAAGMNGFLVKPIPWSCCEKLWLKCHN